MRARTSGWFGLPCVALLAGAAILVGCAPEIPPAPPPPPEAASPTPGGPSAPLQVATDPGDLPEPEDNGVRYLKVPLNRI